jgi:hypothetical protein
LLRIYVLFRLCYYIENDLPRELTKIIIGGKRDHLSKSVAIGLTICFTGYIQWVEHMDCMFRQDEFECYDKSASNPYVNFFDSFFIMMTTVAVIGYLSPVRSEPGKVSMIVIMVIIVVVIPSQSSKLVELIR